MASGGRMAIDWIKEDSELILKYFKAQGLEYTREGNMFIVWKLAGDTLEIHDIYSEDSPGAMLQFAQSFVASIDCKLIEGYVDKEYSERERSDKILRNFGMEPYKETEDFVYYIMEKNG